MKLFKYLKESCILLDMKSRTKEEAIRELAELLKKEKDISDFDEFVSGVFARERQASTGIGHEIGVPHVRTNVVKEVVIAFGRSQKGIDFASIDGKAVKLLFLIGTPQKRKINAYLMLLAHLTRLLKKEAFKKRLLEAPSPGYVLEEFKRVEA